MKLKNKDMKYYVNTYAEYSNNSSIDIDVLVLYKIRKNFLNIENALKPYGDTIKELLKKSDSGVEKIKTQINQLGEQEVDVDIEKISIKDFGDLKTPPAFVNSIFFMLED